MYTDTQIINIGLSGIASSTVQTISPPRTAIERYFSSNYTHIKRTELAKRRWVFARVADYKLTLVQTLTDVEKPYKYAMPIDCLVPIRIKSTEWVQRGRFIYSENPTLAIEYTKNANEDEFDPLFVDVLACALRRFSAEYITGSSSKNQEADAKYRDAVDTAAKANAFIIGTEEIQQDDGEYSWLSARAGQLP